MRLGLVWVPLRSVQRSDGRYVRELVALQGWAEQGLRAEPVMSPWHARTPDLGQRWLTHCARSM